MNQQLHHLVELIEQSAPGPEGTKEALLAVVKELRREATKLQFKAERLEGVRQTLTVMLDESVRELEKKSKTIEEANEALTRTLGELRQHAAAIESQKKLLEEEKTRSEKLLLNILPADIVSELKTYGRSYARKYEEVTVLFADIRDFSTTAETLLPDELVSCLDEYFRGFDRITGKYGLEKIKTIGDAYMCVGGLFDSGENSALQAVRTALDMQEFIRLFGLSKDIQGTPAFSFRIGIHTGAVVAGVIGEKKFAYDIWGDTVNMAARMQQNGAPGKVNISAATYALVRATFACTPRGAVTLKNGRAMDMYFVEEQK